MACLRSDASPEISLAYRQRLGSSARGDQPPRRGQSLIETDEVTQTRAVPTTNRFLWYRVTSETHPIRHPRHCEVRAWQPEEDPVALISRPDQSADSRAEGSTSADPQPAHRVDGARHGRP